MKKHYGQKFEITNASKAKANIRDNLFFGFNNVESVDRMAKQMGNTIPRSINLPISTRGIGFAVRHIVAKFARLCIENLNYHALCTALYRVSLLQLEIKVAHQYLANHGWDHFRNIDIDIDYKSAVDGLHAQFSLIANIIASIGDFKGFGIQYRPRIANPIIHDNLNTWDPTLVTFSTLRNYVQALSVVDTPVHIRRYFYEHNPIPGAIWNQESQRCDAEGLSAEDVNFPLLINADEIMPDNYGISDLHADLQIISCSTESVSRQYPKYVHSGHIDYDAKGNRTQLVSNNVEDLRCSNLKATQPGEQIDYSKALDGEVSDYWSPEFVTDTEFYLGCMHLVGEIPRYPTDAYAPRCSEIGKQISGTHYYSTLQNLFGQM